MTPSTVLLASNNDHKLREFRAMLEPLGFRVLPPRDVGLTLQVEETGASFAENARLKAEALRDFTGRMALADDSGLVVEALGGEPGLYSARYAGPEATDADRTALVLERLRGVPRERRRAHFVAAVAVACPGRETAVFEAAVRGVIADEARGAGGFGYDPIFLYPPAGKTFAEMPPAEKDRVSHRGKALRAVAAYLQAGTCDNSTGQSGSREGVA